MPGEVSRLRLPQIAVSDCHSYDSVVVPHDKVFAIFGLSGKYAMSSGYERTIRRVARHVEKICGINLICVGSLVLKINKFK